MGTSSWSEASWRGGFYSESARPARYLSEYARHFDTVEIDSTFYGPPRPSTVRGWAEKTPEGFLFAAKAPRSITHERVLTDCGAEVASLLRVMDLLGDRLGPILFQFPFFGRRAFREAGEFYARLRAFAGTLPAGYRFAVEIRNGDWVTEPLLDLLRERRIALCLIDSPRMPPATALNRRFDLLTADFSYIRFLGDRRGMEKITTTWDRVRVDRTPEMKAWVPLIRELLGRGARHVFAYFSNHYAGHSPGSVREFEKAWRRLDGEPED